MLQTGLPISDEYRELLKSTNKVIRINRNSPYVFDLGHLYITGFEFHIRFSEQEKGLYISNPKIILRYNNSLVKEKILVEFSEYIGRSDLGFLNQVEVEGLFLGLSDNYGDIYSQTQIDSYHNSLKNLDNMKFIQGKLHDLEKIVIGVK